MNEQLNPGQKAESFVAGKKSGTDNQSFVQEQKLNVPLKPSKKRARREGREVLEHYPGCKVRIAVEKPDGNEQILFEANGNKSQPESKQP